MRTNLAGRAPLISKASYYAILFAFAFIFLSVLASVYSLKELRQYVLSDFGRSLEAVLETSENGLIQWVDRQHSALEQVVASATFAQLNGPIIEQQLMLFNSEEPNSSELISRLNGELQLIQRIKNNKGLVLFSDDGQVVISTAHPSITRNLNIAKYHQNAFERSLSNNGVIPPMVFDKEGAGQQALFMITVPVIIENKSVGVLASFYDAADALSDILSLGRIGGSGETYLFDSTGLMASSSRFNTILEQIGLIEEGESAIMNVRLYDPGINLRFNTSAERSTDELTLMARSAINTGAGTNTEGYRDYRGVTVIGSWKWSSALNMGITTEIDIEEALVSYYSARNIILLLLLLCLCIVLVLGALLLRLIYRAKLKLERAANTLENKVQQRTEQLNQAMAELAQEQSVLNGLFDAIPDPIFCKDHEKRYIRGNKAFFEIFKQAPTEVIGRSDLEISHDKDKSFFDETDEEVLASGKTIIIERVANQEDGVDRLYQTKKSRLPMANGQDFGIIGISRDITEQRKNEEALIRSSQEAQAANQAKSEFLARMSHEIRTPMNGVLGMLDLLMSSELSKEQKDKLKVAKNSAISLLTIINDILDFSRVEAGKVELESIDFDPQSILEDSARALVYLAEEKGIELLVDVTRVKHKQVEGDPLRLRQVVTNLVNNAIKFTEHGHVILKAETIEIDGAIDIHCHVIDTGIGIPSNKIEDLFESFSQVDSSTTRLYGGSGLGLAICKRLCELMGGEISVHSKLGQGSEFSFKVRCLKSSDKAQALLDVEQRAWRVLIVDDNKINLDILSKQLANMGLSCDSANSANVAMNIISSASTPFDLVITDMNMPRVDGLELTQQIRQIPSTAQTKILMLSSTSFSASGSELSELGLNAYLLKPVSTVDLYSTIKLLARADRGAEPISLVTEDTVKGIAKDVSFQFPSWPEYHRVLVVEDNPVNRLVAEGLMQEFGLGHEIATNGQHAIDMLRTSEKEQPYTLVLMDCQMPVMDGYEATHKIREGMAGEHYKQIPIIAMTANALKGDKEKCLQAGMNEYVAKPIDKPELQRALQAGFALTPIELNSHTMRLVNMPSKQAPVKLPKTPLQTMDWSKHPPSLASQVDTYIRGLHLYCTQYQDQQFEFVDTEQGRESLRMTLHTLKGSGGNLGFVKLEKLCSSLESKSKHGKLSLESLSELDTVLKQTLHDAKSLIDANVSDKAQNQVPQRALLEIFEDIKSFTEKSEMVPPTLVEELQRSANQSANHAQLEALVKALEQYDYEKFNEILEKG